MVVAAVVVEEEGDEEEEDDFLLLPLSMEALQESMVRRDSRSTRYPIEFHRRIIPQEEEEVAKRGVCLSKVFSSSPSKSITFSLKCSIFDIWLRMK